MLFSKEALLAAVAAVGVAGFSVNAEAATILTGMIDTNIPVPTDHGSNAAGTPDIALTWSAGWDQYAGWPSALDGDVFQVDQNDLTIDFTPSGGDIAAKIDSFVFNVWTGGGAHTVDWSVTGSASGLLGSGTEDIGDGNSDVVFGAITGVGGETLTLLISETAGKGSYLAMDNLAFDQVVVPEPAAAALVVGGLGVMSMRRKKK